jgi:ribosomal-protein-serine acetyltransferase
MSKFQIADKTELRSFSDENAEELFAVVKKNYEHLRPFLQWVTPDFSIETAREFIERTNVGFAENKNPSYGIFYDEKIVGVIGFVNFSRQNRRIEIGYWIDKDCEGRGFIGKSCKALINYVFDELEINRVEIHCSTENTRSWAIPERLGFTLEGVLRQSEWRHTRFYDMAIYGLLKDEWKNLNEK